MIIRYLWLPTKGIFSVLAYTFVFWNVNMAPAIHMTAWCLPLVAAIGLCFRGAIRIRSSGLNKLEIVLADSYLVFISAVGVLCVMMGFLMVAQAASTDLTL